MRPLAIKPIPKSQLPGHALAFRDMHLPFGPCGFPYPMKEYASLSLSLSLSLSPPPPPPPPPSMIWLRFGLTIFVYGCVFRYEREWYYWELVILARRAGLVLVILANAVPSLQIWFGLMVIVATMTMHFYARPFIDDSLDLLETASLVSLIGFLMTGD